jgi:hypothetical protein
LVCARVMRLLVRIPDCPGENQKLAHLFMICSKIKLTLPTESTGALRFSFVLSYQGDRPTGLQRKMEIPAAAAKYDASRNTSTDFSLLRHHPQRQLHQGAERERRPQAPRHRR